MPTYEYACRACGEHLEVVQSFRDDPLTECPACQGQLRKVFSAAGIIFKGSGWHVKDYATSRTKGASGSSNGASGSDGDSGSASGAGDGDKSNAKTSDPGSGKSSDKGSDNRDGASSKRATATSSKGEAASA